ncbi:HIG1 domain family member 2A, mitochondrial [Emydura macquarii macquarii]|uniref:HIG1 domain family member 2A, mitochondrial n=1 Tax=Emydura macquarii macquarii TaxID=1129001 RepID=UPI00352B4456
MAQSPSSPSPPPFDPSGPPLIEGFVPTASLPREGFGDRFLRKSRENPLVPVGCLATAGALIYGLICFQKGNVVQSQRMMRVRVLAQGFTLTALIVGVVATALKSKK